MPRSLNDVLQYKQGLEELQKIVENPDVLLLEIQNAKNIVNKLKGDDTECIFTLDYLNS